MKDHFFTCHKFINSARIDILDTTPLFEFPMSDDVCRIMMIQKSLKKYGWKEPEHVTAAVENYPLDNLLWEKAYEALADSFSMKIINKWQLAIENNIKVMLKKHYGGLK